MTIEQGISPEEQLSVLESLKPKLGRFIEEKLYSWGLGEDDLLLVDEVGFGYTGIPIFGPELVNIWDQAHIDIVVREEKYTGPRSSIEHPIKIPLPALVAYEISEDYGIIVDDFIKGRDFFDLPTETVRLGNVDVLVPEPVSHVRVFTEDTILRYTEQQVGEDKIKEWYLKLQMLRDVSQQVDRIDVSEVVEEMIIRSWERWQSQGWQWLDAP